MSFTIWRWHMGECTKMCIALVSVGLLLGCAAPLQETQQIRCTGGDGEILYTGPYNEKSWDGYLVEVDESTRAFYPKGICRPEPAKEVRRSPEPASAATESPDPVKEVSRFPEPAPAASKSTDPVKEVSRSPEPAPAATESPDPVKEVSRSPEPAPAATESPDPVKEVSRSPELAPAASRSPDPVKEVKRSPEPAPAARKSPDPVKEVKRSPEAAPAARKSPDPIKEVKRSPEAAPAASKSPGPLITLDGNPATAKQASETSAQGVGLQAASWLATAPYGSVKVAYALVGGIVGGLTWVFTGGNTESAKAVWIPSMTGQYIVQPENLTGDKPLRFMGGSSDKFEP